MGLARFALAWHFLKAKEIALHNAGVEELPRFDKSISGDLLFEMLNLFIGVEKNCLPTAVILEILLVLAAEKSFATQGGCFGKWR